MKRSVTLCFGKNFDQMKEKNWREDAVIRVSASQSADRGFISLVESNQKTLKNGVHNLLAWRLAQKKIVSRTSQEAYFCVLWQDTYQDASIFM